MTEMRAARDTWKSLGLATAAVVTSPPTWELFRQLDAALALAEGCGDAPAEYRELAALACDVLTNPPLDASFDQLRAEVKRLGISFTSFVETSV